MSGFNNTNPLAYPNAQTPRSTVGTQGRQPVSRYPGVLPKLQLVFAIITSVVMVGVVGIVVYLTVRSYIDHETWFPFFTDSSSWVDEDGRNRASFIGVRFCTVVIALLEILAELRLCTRAARAFVLFIGRALIQALIALLIFDIRPFVPPTDTTHSKEIVDYSAMIVGGFALLHLLCSATCFCEWTQRGRDEVVGECMAEMDEFGAIAP